MRNPYLPECIYTIFDDKTIKAWRASMAKDARMLERFERENAPAVAMLKERMKEIRADRVKAIREAKAKKE